MSEKIKVRPIRRGITGLEYQKRAAQEPQNEEAEKMRRKEVQQMLDSDPPLARIDVLERDNETGEVSKYQVISTEDGSVLAYEDDISLNNYRAGLRKTTWQSRERTHKSEIVPEGAQGDPMLEESPKEKTGKGN
jgi:hypothetical protein